MIIKKINIGNDTVNVQITKEEALKSLMNGEEVIFTDETEKTEIYQLLEDLKDDDTKFNKYEEPKKVKSKTSRLSAVLPFLDSKDASLLFRKAIEVDLNINPATIAPFIDETVLTILVDEYLSGKHQGLDVDSLYTFLSSKDVKRLFEYYLNQ